MSDAMRKDLAPDVLKKKGYRNWVLDEGVVAYSAHSLDSVVGIVHPGSQVTVCADSKAITRHTGTDNVVKVSAQWWGDRKTSFKNREITGWIAEKHLIHEQAFKKGRKSNGITNVSVSWGDMDYSWTLEKAGKLTECSANTYVSMKQSCEQKSWFGHERGILLGQGGLLLVSDPSQQWCFSDSLMLSGFCDGNSEMEVKETEKQRSSTVRMNQGDHIAAMLKEIMAGPYGDYSGYISHFSKDLDIVTPAGQLLQQTNLSDLD